MMLSAFFFSVCCPLFSKSAPCASQIRVSPASPFPYLSQAFLKGISRRGRYMALPHREELLELPGIIIALVIT